MIDTQVPVIKPLALISDEPVGDLAGDGLSLEPYAKTLASVALGTKGPFTIGIFGSWGHGKTSLLRLVQSLLKTKANKKLVTTVWFNAWQYEREEHPIVPLTATVIRSLEENYSGFSKGLKKTATALINGLRSVAYAFASKMTVKVPGLAEFEAGFVAKEMSKRYEELKARTIDPLLDQSLYYNAFQTLEKINVQQGKDTERLKVVVFIDDLDRCLPEHALHLLESIKLVLSQPGFIFVMALDKNLIESYLNQRFSKEYGLKEYAHGQSYLDKMIQLPFWIPSHKKRFTEFIRKMLVENNLGELADSSETIDQIIGPGSSFNPRTVIRFFNGLLVDRNIWQQVNPSDEFESGAFMIARILQDHSAKTYQTLVDNPELCQALADGEGRLYDRLPALRDKVFGKEEST